MPTIRIEVGGQSFDAPLPAAAVTIGSAEQVDLRLQCDGVAGKHCTLEPLPDGRHKLSDANSGYSTLVNGIAVKQVSLSEGDVVDVGQARIVYTLAGGVAAAAVAEAIPAAAAPDDEIPSADEIPDASATPPAASKPKPAPPTKASAPARSKSTAKAERSAAASDGSSTPAKQATADDADGTRRAARPAKKKTGVVIAAVVGVAALLVVVFAINSAGDSGQADAALLKIYEQGKQAYEDKDYATARELLARVSREGRNTTLGRKADDSLRLVNTVEAEMDQRLALVWAERLDLDAAALQQARDSFAGTYGDAQLTRFDEMRTKVRQDQERWKQAQLSSLEQETADLLGTARFSDARALWRKLARSAPGGIDVSAEVDAAQKKLLVDAEARAVAFEKDADDWIEAGQAFRSVKLLEDMLPRFADMPAQERLKKALARSIEARDKPIHIDRTKPGPGTQPNQPTKPGPTIPIAPPTDDSQRKALEAQVASIRAAAQAAVAKRLFQDASELVRKELAAVPDGKEHRALADFAVDLALAEVGLRRLITAIHENPKRFGGVKLTERLTVSLVDADRDLLSARVKGGSSKWKWERVASSAFESLVKRMRPEKDDALAMAGLLHGVGQSDAAARMLYDAGKKGVPTSELFPVLARWKQESIPQGGYVVYDERYVTQAEKDFLIQEARITAALRKVDAKDPAARKAAYAVLLKIGEPAEERLAEALRRRRAYLISEVTSSKSFTSGKYMSKLLQLLAQRRQHALALIYDAAAYPYPNPNKKNQKEVEARVDQVREVWERPFDLVAQWDSKLKDALQTITEVDEVLSRVDDGYNPDLQEIKDRINKAINVPGSADPNVRDYSLKVLVFNTTVKTTATFEEKNNVRSVNDYRMMMGLQAVRINERLQRAARGHSRHMQQNGYFAHDVPSTYATPQNRTPGARCKVQGFGSGVGENIARGPSTGHGAFMAWFGSSGHHRNMLGRGWTQLGCGRAAGTWWTQNFGGGSKSLKEPDPLPPPAPAYAPDPEDKSGRPLPPGEAELPDDAPPSDDGGESDGEEDGE